MEIVRAKLDRGNTSQVIYILTRSGDLEAGDLRHG
jgi:hypothetical protein